MNNILGNDISRRRLCTENTGNGTHGQLTGLDFQVLMDNIKCIHLLTFVLMQSLDLNVEYRVGIDGNAFFFFDVRSQFCFLLLLNLL